MVSPIAGETLPQGRFEKVLAELDVLPDFVDCCFHYGNCAKIAAGDFDNLGPKSPLHLPFVEGVHNCKGLTVGT